MMDLMPELVVWLPIQDLARRGIYVHIYPMHSATFGKVVSGKGVCTSYHHIPYMQGMGMNLLVDISAEYSKTEDISNVWRLE